MSLKKLGLIASLIAVIGLAPSSALLAQPLQPRVRALRYAPPHIVITPRPLLYRRCIERLELQNRPSGPVLYPLTYCWWVRR